MTLNNQLANEAGFVALLPDQLHEHLRDLRHTTHDLEYREEHRLSAALKLQAWWRGIVWRRIAFIIKISTTIRIITKYMEARSTSISSWFKGKRMRWQYHDAIVDEMNK